MSSPVAYQELTVGHLDKPVDSWPFWINVAVLTVLAIFCLCVIAAHQPKNGLFLATVLMPFRATWYLVFYGTLAFLFVGLFAFVAAAFFGAGSVMGGSRRR